MEDATIAKATETLVPETGRRKLFIESYGCQMNFSDSEIVASILKENGIETTTDLHDADIVFLNTCAIREKAETAVRNRLTHFQYLKRTKPDVIIGVLGCMAERLKTKLVEEEKIVDLVAGPDAYRDLPNLLRQIEEGHKAVNTFLSREETYFDINPVRLNSNGVSAFISIMRGCDNMCSFCVVPFTRGRERSRDPYSILNEMQELESRRYKEVTLLGQNVDSYKWGGRHPMTFAQLLDFLATNCPSMRIRFSTSHPKDMTDEALYVMSRHDNLCKYIHLPVQSGSSRILELMNRGYTREWYLQKIKRIRETLGEDCGLSSDMITGFCGETEEEHRETLSLMEAVEFDYAYMFMYSERPGTPAAKKYADDVPQEVKKRRLDEIISLQNAHSQKRNRGDIGKTFSVLIEGDSRRDRGQWQGRNSQNKVIVFDKEHAQKGACVSVKVHACTGGTLLGKMA